MISRHKAPIFLIVVCALSLSACAAPRVSSDRALSPDQAQRLVDRQQELADQLLEVRGEIDQVRETLQAQQSVIDELERSALSAVAGGTQENGAREEGGTELSPTEVYRESFAAYASADYARAIEGFELFIENFPDSSHAGNAYYWLGESYFAQGDYEQAVSSLRSLVEKFPQSAKVPEGLLRVAQSYEKMDQPERAEKILDLLRERYPDSQAARRSGEAEER